MTIQVIAPTFLRIRAHALPVLHTPKLHDYYRPIGNFSFILFPPIGLLGLADYLRKNGHTARLIHLGVEQHNYPPLDLTRIVAEEKPGIVGLDLHSYGILLQQLL